MVVLFTCDRFKTTISKSLGSELWSAVLGPSFGPTWPYFSGSKRPLRARYCSEMLFVRFKKAPAGTLLLRNAIFQVQKSPCGHVAAQKYIFLGTWAKIENRIDCKQGSHTF